MAEVSIYSDIARRTGGDIYIGVAGPVRTGKSTFIKKFMDTLVLPNMTDSFARERTLDEMPQSASGKTVMTTEPKFIPNDAARVVLPEGAEFNVKLIDCVGYIVPGALGLMEEEKPRMVMTPWADEPIPFEEAAETGTRKVIKEHSTVGILITTDGSFSELSRENYESAEQRVIEEMKASGKPFTVVLNSSEPESNTAKELAATLEEKYGIPVSVVNCLEISEDDIKGIITKLLYEFPVTELKFHVPAWISTLANEHPLRCRICQGIAEKADTVSRLSELKDAFSDVYDDVYGTGLTFISTTPSDGSATLEVSVPKELFYKILGDETGLEIKNDADLVNIVTNLAVAKRKYEKFRDALEQVEATGYGIVTPNVEDMTLEEPEIVKQAGSYGVKLKASAPSIHLIKADIQSEVCPIVGSEKQSEDVVKFLLKGFEENPASIWESNIFGKSLHELVNEGLNAKLSHMPHEARLKLADTLRKIINEGSNGLICILL